MSKRRRPLRAGAVAALVAGAVIVAAGWMLVGRNPGSDQFNFVAALAGLLAVVAVLGGVLLWAIQQTPAPAASAPSQRDAAGQLAEQTLVYWQDQVIRRRIATPAPARVRWHWEPPELAFPQADVMTSPTPDADRDGETLSAKVVTHLHDEVYLRPGHRRLLIVGEPGAGKTAVMILLLLAALDHRGRLDAEQRSRAPVPVWLTLGRWDPAATSLLQWARDTINRDHPYLQAREHGEDAASDLLGACRVSLFLDGLDEMPADSRRRALERIRDEAGGLPVVMTSRTSEYHETLAAEHLDNAAIIELGPVDPRDAADYLLHGQTGPQLARWRKVSGYLREHPDSVAARALSTPLALSLARETYQHDDPADLTDLDRHPTPQDLRAHLLASVLLTAYPDPPARDHAVRWLAWLACHMGQSRDLAWWLIPGWVPAWQITLVGGLWGMLIGGLVGVPMGVLGGVLWGAQALAAGLIIGLFGGGVGGCAVAPLSEQTLEPRWDLQRKAPYIPSGPIWVGFPGPELGYLAGDGFVGALVGTIVSWLVFAPAFVFVAERIRPRSRSPAAAPIGTYRANQRAGNILALALMLGGAFLIGVGATLWRSELVGLLPFVLAFGLAFGLAAMPAGLLRLAEVVLVFRLRGRARFMRLCEDALDRQVLRQAGAVYQFRHAELQDHLAAAYRQRP